MELHTPTDSVRVVQEPWEPWCTSFVQYAIGLLPLVSLLETNTVCIWQKTSRIFIGRNEFMQWMDGAVVDLISIAGTGGLGLMMGSHWVEHCVSSRISSSPDVVASHFFFLSYSLGKLELKSKILDKVGGAVLHFIPLFMPSAQI